MQSSLTDLLTHGVASVMAILEYLLRCFRRRSPASDQNRPLCTEDDSAQDESTDGLPHEHASQQSVLPVGGAVQAFPCLSAQHDSTSEHLGMADDSSCGRTDSATLAQVCTVHQTNADQQPVLWCFQTAFTAVRSCARHPGWYLQIAAAAQPPTPVLKGTIFASASEQALVQDTSPPLELRTRNIIARTPLAGPSPASATPASANGSAGALPFSHTTPQSTLHQVGTPTSPDFQLCRHPCSKHCF